MFCFTGSLWGGVSTCTGSSVAVGSSVELSTYCIVASLYGVEVTWSASLSRRLNHLTI